MAKPRTLKQRRADKRRRKYHLFTVSDNMEVERTHTLCGIRLTKKREQEIREGRLDVRGWRPGSDVYNDPPMMCAGCSRIASLNNVGAIRRALDNQAALAVAALEKRKNSPTTKATEQARVDALASRDAAIAEGRELAHGAYDAWQESLVGTAMNEARLHLVGESLALAAVAFRAKFPRSRGEKRYVMRQLTMPGGNPHGEYGDVHCRYCGVGLLQKQVLRGYTYERLTDPHTIPCALRFLMGEHDGCEPGGLPSQAALDIRRGEVA